MFRKRSHSRQSWVGYDLGLEFLEDRRLLAGDFRPGDSNLDYHVDEADFVQAMRSGKFETDQAATWGEGDWNKNGRFNSGDLVIAFTNGLFKTGPYDPEAGPPVNQLRPLAVDGEADVSVFYFPDNGDLVAISPNGFTALHWVSRSGSFRAQDGRILFDVETATSQFTFDPAGWYLTEYSDLLPAGWSSQQVLDDLLVDGARIGGGGLGNVRLRSLDDFLTEKAKLPDDPPKIPNVNVPNRNGNAFVARDQANGLLTYDPPTGDIRIETLDRPITTLELVATEQVFTGAIDNASRYKVGVFDVANATKLFRLNPQGMTQIDLPGLARTGMTAEEFANTVYHNGSILGGGVLRLALSVLTPPVLRPGDANGDFFFDEADLIQVLKSGKFGSDDQAIWSEGDWDGDQRFDQADLTKAMRESHGFYTGDPYDGRAVAPVHQRQELVSDAVTDVVLQYDSANGNLVLLSQQAELTSFHLVSVSGMLRESMGNGTFDVASERSHFVFDPDGFARREWSGVLPVGLTQQQLVADLQVDGSFMGGGGPARVSLSVVAGATSRIAGRLIRDFDSDGILKPDREAGQDNIRVRLVASRTGLVHTVRTTSVDSDGNGQIDSLTEAGLFSFGFLADDRYRLLIDEPESWNSTQSEPIEIDVSRGSVVDDLQIGVSSRWPTEFVPGDANQDFYFDESDWILALKAGQYGQRATWSEGDFDGDRDFDSADIDAALRTLAYDPGGAPYRDTALAPQHGRISLSTDQPADVYVMYIPASGYFGVVASIEFTALQIHSRSGHFLPSETLGPFDVSSTHSAFWMNPEGIDISHGKTFPGVPGLTAEGLLADLTLDGARRDGRALAGASISIVVPEDLALRCQEIRASGAVIGDVNFDGAFNSTDLVFIFQRGEYQDIFPNNSDWFDGDWNCDGEFDSSDIVEAFQSGSFDVAARPVAATMAAMSLLDPAGLHGDPLDRLGDDEEIRLRLKKREARTERNLFRSATL